MDVKLSIGEQIKMPALIYMTGRDFVVGDA
jgi:hypothetical protein